MNLGALGEEILEGGVGVFPVVDVGKGFKRRVLLAIIPYRQVVRILHRCQVKLYVERLKCLAMTYAGSSVSPFLVNDSSHSSFGLGCSRSGLYRNNHFRSGSLGNRWCHVVLRYWYVVSLSSLSNYSRSMSGHCLNTNDFEFVFASRHFIVESRMDSFVSDIGDSHKPSYEKVGYTEHININAVISVL